MTHCGVPITSRLGANAPRSQRGASVRLEFDDYSYAASYSYYAHKCGTSKYQYSSLSLQYCDDSATVVSLGEL